jgi:hypothetical protein
MPVRFRSSFPVFRASGYRLYFFSAEESRTQVHVQNADGQAQFWLEPEVAIREPMMPPETTKKPIGSAG